MPDLRLMLVVGAYAIKWHLGKSSKANLTETVAAWRSFAIPHPDRPYRIFPMPHPSWRNNTWLKKNPWFTDELLPELRESIAAELKTP